MSDEIQLREQLKSWAADVLGGQIVNRGPNNFEVYQFPYPVPYYSTRHIGRILSFRVPRMYWMPDSDWNQLALLATRLGYSVQITEETPYQDLKALYVDYTKARDDA